MVYRVRLHRHYFCRHRASLSRRGQRWLAARLAPAKVWRRRGLSGPPRGPRVRAGGVDEGESPRKRSRGCPSQFHLATPVLPQRPKQERCSQDKVSYFNTMTFSSVAKGISHFLLKCVFFGTWIVGRGAGLDCREGSLLIRHTTRQYTS